MGWIRRSPASADPVAPGASVTRVPGVGHGLDTLQGARRLAGSGGFASEQGPRLDPEIDERPREHRVVQAALAILPGRVEGLQRQGAEDGGVQ